MSAEKEQEVKLLFLEEAKEYLDTIESGLLGLGSNGVNRETIDAVLRAAHSIKGGAAMMGFSDLSELSHRLEDFFKILKSKKVETDDQVERLFLLASDRLRQVLKINSEGEQISQKWLETEANPIIEQLRERLGDFNPEDEANLLSQETGEDMGVILFQTEVEELLGRLELVLEENNPCVKEEFVLAAQQLDGLAQMLELPAFANLCQGILESLENEHTDIIPICNLALEQLRRSQALVIIGQTSAIAPQFDLSSLSQTQFNFELPEELPETEFNFELPETDFNLDLPEELPETELNFDFPTELPEADFADFNLSLESVGEFAELPEIETPEIIPSKIEPETPKIAEQTISKATSLVAEDDKSDQKESAEQTIRVSIKQLELLSDSLGEFVIERNALDLQLKSLRNFTDLLKRRVKLLEKSNFSLRTAYDQVINTEAKVNGNNNFSSLKKGFQEEQLVPSLTQDFDRLELDQYSDIHLLSGEVMETVVQLQEVTTDLDINVEETEKTVRELNRTAKLMQNQITRVRMRPVSDLLNRFPRSLRNMALQYGKQVDLQVKGGGTLIDRSILEALNDPLLHLFRNAFDHGIEDPKTRKTHGKPEQGVISITAGYRGNKTVITISDDGRGIDLEKIKAKALKMGLNERELKQASKNELLDLIFEPGFSTAEKVTDLSGRGVGMDVVRTNLQQVRGEVAVDTKLGQGTTFTITVPFTLSVIRVLLVESDGLLLAFPTNAVEEVLLLNPEMIVSAAGKDVLNWEGYMMPLIQLAKGFRFPVKPQMQATESIPIINQSTVLMVAQGYDLVGIQVDRYWGEQEVTIRQVEGNIPLPPGFTGCTILGDGRVVPLLDAIALLKWMDEGSNADMRTNSLTLKPAAIAPIGDNFYQQKTLLVVDDSINVRRFLAMTLEKAGYRVEQAKDGLDALEKLQSGINAQAVVCDIEMPRLDGYGFLAHIKADPNCKNIPVIMLTSRSGSKHRQLAMSLGATDYFSKPFKEQQLLEKLTQLTK